MTATLSWITENLELFFSILLLIFLLRMTGTIFETYKEAKKGLASLFNPVGFIIVLTLAYICWQVWLGIQATL